MNRRLIIGALALALLIATVALAGGDAYVGTYKGTAVLLYEMPTYGSSMTYNGTAEVTITKQSDESYRVQSLTNFEGMPEAEDAMTYKYQGGALTYSDSADEMGVMVEQSGKLTLSGSDLTGTVTMIGKLDGQIQTKSTTTYSVKKQ
ncbi:MAG: hypothetical protein P9M14_13780 [Candidatus Alcyoniella australis]|nr:hypothetical protein [Candidatus Alcyoniella australis]